MAGVIFVAGVTASGKTTACQRMALLIGSHASIIHLGLIACGIGKKHGLASDTIEGTGVENLDRIQLLLLEYIESYLNVRKEHEITILDGHLVLAGIERPSYFLPVWFFARLAVSSILLCEVTSEIVRERSFMDIYHQRPAVVIESSERYCAEEAMHASWLTQRLRIPLVTIKSANEIDCRLLTRLNL